MPTLKQFFAAPLPAGAAFRIRGIGLHERMRPCLVDRRTGTTDYLFMCFHDPVHVWEKEALRAVPPSSLVIWEPGKRHCYGNTERAWAHSWMHCEGPFLARALRAVRLPRNRVLPLLDPLILEKALAELHAELTLHRRPDPVILRDTFEILLRALARRLREPDAPAPVPARFRSVKAWIDSHYDRPVTLAVLARQTHLSVPHFCKEFKRSFGVPAIDYLIRMRLQAAMHHLGDCNRSITEVARLSGYENLFHFSRLFKQRFGTSPRAMRARIAGAALINQARTHARTGAEAGAPPEEKTSNG
jgi:AraC-like DNA-binding protein